MISGAVNYSADLLQREYEARAHVRLALRSLMDTYAIRDMHVAEVGSGLGYNLEIFSACNSVIGVEGLRDAAESATNRGVPTVIADLSTPLPLESGAYDVVLCLDVLEHLVDPGFCLREAHRILCSAGLIVINVPNHFSLSGRVNILRGSGIDSVRFFPGYADWENPHVRFFRHASIAELIDRSGFRIDADWSARFPSLPMLWRWPLLCQSSFARSLARLAPDLFSGGFFMIGRK